MHRVPSFIDVNDLVDQLRQLGIVVWVQDSRLWFKAPEGRLTPELKQCLTDNKHQLLKLLSSSNGSRDGARVIEPLLLGPSDRHVFAIYHRPVGGSGQVLTVICPPLFNEYMRTHLALRELAISLAERGQHVLRFDYRGTGDSFGDLGEVTVSDWVEDITLAVRQGRDLSGTSAVRLLGVRAGALLACRSMGTSADVERLVLWDPVRDGAGYLESMRRIQEEITEQDHSLSEAERRETLHDYAGYRLSEHMVKEFRSLDASVYSSVPKGKLHVFSTSSEAEFPVSRGQQNLALFACNWETDLESLMMPKLLLERLGACLTTS